MRRRLTNALMALPAALAPMPALAQAPAGRPDYWHYDWGWGHMIFGSIMMVLFWGGIIVVVVLAVRWLGSGSSHGTMPAASRNKALDILQERFARGEIDQDEFEQRKRLLTDWEWRFSVEQELKARSTCTGPLADGGRHGRRCRAVGSVAGGRRIS